MAVSTIKAQPLVSYVDVNVGGTVINQQDGGSYWGEGIFTVDVPNTFRCINANPKPGSWWSPSVRVAQCALSEDKTTVKIGFASTQSITLKSNCTYRLWYIA